MGIMIGLIVEVIQLIVTMGTDGFIEVLYVSVCPYLLSLIEILYDTIKIH